MTLIINFLIFSLSIFICNMLSEFSLSRIHKTRGLTHKPILALFDISPSYLRSLHIIIIIFLSTQITNLILLPLLIIFLSKINLNNKRFGHWLVKLSGLLCLLVSITSIQLVAKSTNISENPLVLTSYIMAFIGTVILNYNPFERIALNISRGLALNIIILNTAMSSLSFIYISLLSCIIYYLQFLTLRFIPVFNLFERSRKSTVLAILSFLGLTLTALWEHFKSGGW